MEALRDVDVFGYVINRLLGEAAFFTGDGRISTRAKAISTPLTCEGKTSS